jgi:methylphosphotriester-DNA--protein-cysteine methyltransferase
MGRGLCNTHYSQWRKAQLGPTPRRASDVIEDARWLLDAGETVENTARRCGYTSMSGFYKALRRAGDTEFLELVSAQGIEEARWMRAMAS